MNKLLQANFSRLKKSRIFWLSVTVMLIYAIAAVLYQYNEKAGGHTVTLDSVFNLPYIMSGILLAVFCSLFIGTEYSDGTIRNKIIVGNSRSAVYFANFIVSAVVGLIMNLAFFAVACVLGIPLLGFFTEGTMTVVLSLITGVMMTISFAAIFTLITMLSKSKALSAVICCIGILGAIFVASYVYSALGEPEFVDAYMLDSSSSLVVTKGIFSSDSGTEMVPNSRYLTGAKREIYQFLVDFPPSGQMIQIIDDDIPNLNMMLIYSLIIIIAANFAGMRIFKQKDLK
jgi:hypothetical protein